MGYQSTVVVGDGGGLSIHLSAWNGKGEEGKGEKGREGERGKMTGEIEGKDGRAVGLMID